jgi:hypothetical protein
MFSDWLEETGCLERIEKDQALEELAEDLQDQINEIFKLPEIRELNLDLFQRLSTRLAAIPSDSGQDKGVQVQGQQIVAGTLAGLGEGGGVQIQGDEPGLGVEATPTGNESVTQKPRRLRSGIQIAYVSEVTRPERAWADPGLQAIAINKSNPAFACADILAEKQFYTIDECLKVVCETIEDENQRQDVLNRMLQGYLKLTKGA